MIVAGGLYREICDWPPWNAVFGSGGRASAATSALSRETVLHTYATPRLEAEIQAMRNLGIKVVRQEAQSDIAFAYFHPLSQPHIEPPLGRIKREPALHVSGEVVLRFGFLEGEAIVEGERVVYDPQTAVSPQLFRTNGSRAGNLALVLNEQELCRLGSSADLAVAARAVMTLERAAVVVAKGGPRGATIFEATGRTERVPAYRSDRVFKIGSGDVFSAMFAHYWGERQCDAAEAGDLASRSVAAYCNTRTLPSLPASMNLKPVGVENPGTVYLLGATNTLGRRWAMEQARWCIRDLGAEVICPALDNPASSTELSARIEHNASSAALALCDGAGPEVLEQIPQLEARGIPTIVLQEDTRFAGRFAGEQTIATNDFTTGMYFAVWATMR